MQQAGISPTDVTCISALTACSHAELVDQGMSIFNQLVRTAGHISIMIYLRRSLTAGTSVRAALHIFYVIDLENVGKLMELLDVRLGSDYDVEETMVIINLALLCTTISPADKSARSAVISTLEGRIVHCKLVVEQSASSGIKEMSILIPCTDSTTSATDWYPINGFD
ncbi:hypothetical protein OSB04_005958 [Centaurea solstitialis]|uniref:Uncharacterized protein n=1 Tax=Centaurea solstitialis TaxID=347529 RepID=A0AA38U1M8_9ASTR|nr:hypothetical protein OSB04_005958 [Centaurea solstitialis]